MNARVEMKILLVGLVSLLTLSLSCSDDKSPVGPAPDNSLLGRLTNLADRYDIPAAAGIVFDHDSIIDLQAVGVRRFGDTATATPQDLIHIGSLTKWMTATMIATLVEEGKLAWTTKPAEVIPGLPGSLDSGYSDITLLDLLRHRAGIPADDDFDSIPALTGTLREQRLQASLLILTDPPAVSRGTFRYSNAGYMIAACMAECVTDQDWRALMNTRLFQPLGIDAFYGWPTEHDPAQPWGHIVQDGNFVPVEPSVEPSEIDFLEPAGFVSMTLEDYRCFIDLQMDALQGHPRLLGTAIFDTLNTPVGDYACGVGRYDRAYGHLYGHDGSNTYFYMLMYLIPEKDIALAIWINAYDESLLTPVARAAEDILAPYLK